METRRVCPSVTGTRVHEAEMRSGVEACMSKEVLSRLTPPNIFRVSHSIFSSSPLIQGTTLSSISKLGTPGYPPPLTAWRVLTTQVSIGPKDFSSAARGMTRAVVEQLALVTMKPFERGG